MEQRPGIYQHLAAHVPDDGGAGLDPDGYQLPDAAPPEEGGLRWAPGALAGVLRHHTAEDQQEGGAAPGSTAHLVPLLLAAGPEPGPAWQQVHDSALSLDRVRWDADLLDALTPAADMALQQGERPPYLELARWLAFTSGDTGPVLLGIALLRLGHDDEDRARLLTLARHDSFTLHVLMTLGLSARDRSPDDLDALARTIAEVGRCATGWGRIEAVERIPRGAPYDVRRWLVCGGYDNTVMVEYTALPAVVVGDLVELLRGAARPDPELVRHAMRLVQVLAGADVHGGPAGALSGFEQSPELLGELLDRVTDLPPSLDFWHLAHTLLEWLPEHPDQVGTHRAATVAARLRGLLGAADWADLARADLASSDRGQRWLADHVATRLGIDTFPALLAAAQRDRDLAALGLAGDRAGTQRGEEFARVAEELLLLPEPDERGSRLRPEAFSTMVALRRLPGVGWPVVHAALHSPDPMMRTMAYGALNAWGREQWPPGAEAQVRAAVAAVDDDNARQFAQRAFGPSE